ncbi:hypothetical protein N665_0427s0017 [Sinapis alba]|nr:hypothetical protein N665_0427s0017 [Sinapis alba]
MKHTKRKQKIEMKKVEDRMITFSKRKSEIFKKMNDIVSLCDEKILKNYKMENKEKMWWTTPTEGLSVKELKWRRQTFVDLHVSLSDMALKHFGNDCVGSSSCQETCGRDGETYA